MSFPLLQTKFFIPSPQHLLPRQHLLNLLEEGRTARHRLMLLSSSAGSGKTSLLSEWAARHVGECCWISLDTADNEPARFWKYFITALQRVQPGMGQQAAGLLEAPQPVPSQTVLVALLNEFMNSPKALILVLDDYHVISNLEIHSGLAFLLEHLPPQIALVLSTRADPPLPIVRLRAHNLLTEIREANLRFSADEAAAFLKSMGLNLSQADVLAIETRTEGWIAGLQLVGLALKAHAAAPHAQNAGPGAFISAFTGSRQHILDYLAEEVLSNLEKPVQDFLLQTSILERMCAELCAEVTGGAAPASRAMLAALERGNLFTIPLDEEHEWFRYHHLFADLLAKRLSETCSAAEIRALHSRASAWLARSGLSDEAIRQALLGQDFEQAAALIEPLARAMMFSGRVNTLRDWIAAIPETCLRGHPRLKINLVWIELMQGICDLSKEKVRETELLIESLPPTPENNQLKVELMVVLCRFIAISGDTVQARRVAQQALAILPEEDTAARARVHSALAIAHGLDGDLEQSEADFLECLRLARASGYYSLAAHTTMMVAMGNTHFGRLRKPAEYLQEVIAWGARGTQKMFPAGQGMIGLASIYLEWNDLDAAEKLLQEGLELCRQGGIDGAFNAAILMARLRQARGDLAGALEEIQSTEKTFQRKDHDTAARQVQILLAMGAAGAAAQWVTPINMILKADPATQRVPFLFLEVVRLTLARILIARGELDEARLLLDELLARAEAGKRNGHRIEAHTLLALALQQQNGGKVPPAALEHLQRALALAEPEGYTLLFVEMGAGLIPLLNGLLRQPGCPAPLKKYAGALLTAFPGQPAPAAAAQPAAPAPAPAAPPDELSQREIEILRLIDAGCSNQEIATRLFITLHTVKKHSSHIFAKLGVTSRTQAVAQARRLGLL